jgi:hypothetical protein
MLRPPAAELGATRAFVVEHKPDVEVAPEARLEPGAELGHPLEAGSTVRLVGAVSREHAGEDPRVREQATRLRLLGKTSAAWSAVTTPSSSARGFGGGITACRLAQAGWRVCVLSPFSKRVGITASRFVS